MTEELITKFLWIGAAVFGGVLLLATAVKMREVWRARGWLTVPGRIVSSKVESRRRTGVGGKAGAMGNYPAVVYEYVVQGRKYTGKRLSIGEEVADAGVERTLGRYPKGAEVDVYYNPAKPQEAVLERDLPPNFGKAIGGLLAFIIGAAVILPIGFKEFTARISGYLDKPENAPWVAFLLGLAAFTAMIAFALQRQQSRVKGWIATSGTILESAVEARMVDHTEPGAGRDHRVIYRPRITYAYDVRGWRYQSDRVNFGGQTGGMMLGWLRRWLAGGREPNEKVVFIDSTGGRGNPDNIPPWVALEAGKYAKGLPLNIYYDPENPAEAVLEKRFRAMPVLYLVALGLLLLALAAGGVIGR
jgi:hypothetical protein